ncbi:Der1-like protein [Ascobolus immersus RN42]|uniref:Derlin n=1 Tax=Ascobolus immersus RN42 TaxID=1160509 RepID=A0A3N4ICL1_ASCIM|nr:Der1-like protein [Ascobolus immersus RN42]
MADINPLEQWFYDIPVVTRYWTSAAVLTSVLVQCNFVTPFQLFLSLPKVYKRREYWRLLTTFLYFGRLDVDLLFHLFFLSRYSRLLEDSFVRARTADYAWLLFYGAVSLLALSPVTSIHFLGRPLSYALVYIWARRNPTIQLSFLGLFVFTAPYLPWVLLGFSLILHGEVPKDDLLGIVVGHVYYFFQDIYPRMYNGSKPLDPPQWWRRMFGELPTAPSETIQQPVVPEGIAAN